MIDPARAPGRSDGAPDGTPALTFHERPALGEPEGLLILHHGRGTDELDLLPLAGVLDPRGRLLVVAPRAPLSMPCLLYTSPSPRD